MGHRDELYFLALRPAWGYVDQPPLAPLLARAFSNLLGPEPWAIRMPATLATATTVCVVALVTRETAEKWAPTASLTWAHWSARTGQDDHEKSGSGLEVLDEQDDVGSAVGSADADVAELAGDAQGDGAGPL